VTSVNTTSLSILDRYEGYGYGTKNDQRSPIIEKPILRKVAHFRSLETSENIEENDPTGVWMRRRGCFAHFHRPPVLSLLCHHTDHFSNLSSIALNPKVYLYFLPFRQCSGSISARIRNLVNWSQGSGSNFHQNKDISCKNWLKSEQFRQKAEAILRKHIQSSILWIYFVSSKWNFSISLVRCNKLDQ